MKIGIIYVYYDNNPVVLQHLNLINQYNSDCTIIPLETKKSTDKRVWRNCDLAIYDWYKNDRKVECDYWIYLEWDTYCTVPLRPIYEPTYPCTAAMVKFPISNWYWFKDFYKLPDQYHQYVCGVVPFCGTAICDEGLKRISEIAPRSDIFCELRFGTLANFLGYKPRPLETPTNLHSHTVKPDSPGIWHKVTEYPFSQRQI